MVLDHFTHPIYRLHYFIKVFHWLTQSFVSEGVYS